MSKQPATPYDSYLPAGSRRGLGGGGLRSRGGPSFQPASTQPRAVVPVPCVPRTLRTAAPASDPMDVLPTAATPQKERARSPITPQPVNVESLGAGFKSLPDSPPVLVSPRQKADTTTYLSEGVHRSPEFDPVGQLVLLSAHSESAARAKFSVTGDGALADALKRRFESAYVCLGYVEHLLPKSMGDSVPDPEPPLCECSVFSLFLHTQGTLAVTVGSFAAFVADARASLADPAWISATTGAVPLFTQAWANSLLATNVKVWDARTPATAAPSPTAAPRPRPWPV